MTQRLRLRSRLAAFAILGLLASSQAATGQAVATKAMPQASYATPQATYGSSQAIYGTSQAIVSTYCPFPSGYCPPPQGCCDWLVNAAQNFRMPSAPSYPSSQFTPSSQYPTSSQSVAPYQYTTPVQSRSCCGSQLPPQANAGLRSSSVAAPTTRN